MLDLGTSINIMLLIMFTSLSLSHLKPTNVVIELANRRTVQPTGLFKDVLINVNFVFFFRFLDFGHGWSRCSFWGINHDFGKTFPKDNPNIDWPYGEIQHTRQCKNNFKTPLFSTLTYLLVW